MKKFYLNLILAMMTGSFNTHAGCVKYITSNQKSITNFNMSEPAHKNSDVLLSTLVTVTCGMQETTNVLRSALFATQDVQEQSNIVKQILLNLGNSYHFIIDISPAERVNLPDNMKNMLQELIIQNAVRVKYLDGTKINVVTGEIMAAIPDDVVFDEAWAKRSEEYLEGQGDGLLKGLFLGVPLLVYGVYNWFNPKKSVNSHDDSGDKRPSNKFSLPRRVSEEREETFTLPRNPREREETGGFSGGINPDPLNIRTINLENVTRANPRLLSPEIERAMPVRVDPQTVPVINVANTMLYGRNYEENPRYQERRTYQSAMFSGPRY